jgi:hypothetical protein
MNKKHKVVLMRGVRSLGAIIAAGLAAWIAGPEALGVLGEEGQAIAATVGIPALLMIDKYLRFVED